MQRRLGLTATAVLIIAVIGWLALSGRDALYPVVESSVSTSTASLENPTPTDGTVLEPSALGAPPSVPKDTVPTTSMDTSYEANHGEPPATVANDPTDPGTVESQVQASSAVNTEPESDSPALTAGLEPAKTTTDLVEGELLGGDTRAVIEESAFTRSERPPPKGEETPPTPESPTTVEGAVYTWQDGDVTRQVRLQVDLVSVEDYLNIAEGDIVTRSGGGAVVKATGITEGESQPVFRSESGHLMSLPGGVVLFLDPEWETSEVNAFFTANSIALHSVSNLGEVPNAFLVKTEPGLASLELANALANLNGVEVSSPNWWMESETK